ncbi:sphingosine-1-phosphate lyase isoform X1 [Rhodnius prolixus]
MVLPDLEQVKIVIGSAVSERINNRLNNVPPLKIITYTASSVLATVWLWNFIFQPESVYSRSKKYIFKLARKIPFIAEKVDKEMSDITRSFKDDVEERCKTVPFNISLNAKGKTKDDILEELRRNLNLGSYDWKKGFVSGTVYYHSQDLIDLLTNVYGLASYTNPLHPDVFPGVNKMEAEVVRIALNLFHGSPDSCGTMTTGGTESILMACKAYRDFAREEKGITKPEMILPRTAHPAFEKGAEYFGIKVKFIPVDPETTKAPIDKIRRAISSRTVMIVGSVPNYPYGTIDDIEAIAAVGKAHNIPVHVDSCLGGFLTVFMPAAGFEFPRCDFSVPGVTSISADTHKYGYAPKGSSLILYSHSKYRHAQYCVTTDWPGGIYGSPTVNGSRAGGIIAACWATLMYFGMDGYVDATKKIITVARYIETELRKIKGIFIFGQPATSVIALGSDLFHIYRLSEKLNEKGWNLNPLQFPSGIHLCVTHMHTQEGVADNFIKDVKTIVSELLKEPFLKVEGKMAVYGMSHEIPDRTIVADFTRLYIDSMYYTPKEEKNFVNGVS